MEQTDLDRWISEHGPLLYHVTAKESSVKKICSRGLIPWNQGPGGALEDPWTPRVDHVYLGTLEALAAGCKGHMENYPAAGLFSVDLRNLNLENINPDEDAFWSPLAIVACHEFLFGATTIMTTNATLYEDGMGLSDPFLEVADETFDLEMLDYPEGTVALPLDKRAYRSYGQWAEANDLGSNPAHTSLSLEQAGTIAYRGRISPALVSHVKSSVPTLPRLLSDLREPARLLA